MLFTTERVTTQSTLRAFIVSLFFLSPQASADGIPPWIDPAVGLELPTSTSDELIEYASWFLDRELDDNIRSSVWFYAVPHVIYDLAYPYINESNDDPKAAITLAERMNLRDLVFKEVILADLKYSLNGAEPDPARYDHAIFKTALFLTQFPIFRFFPRGIFKSENLDLDALQYELFKSFKQMPRPHSFEENIMQGDRNAYEISKEVLNAIPFVLASLEASSRCDLVKEGLSFMMGDTPIGKDLEMAELLFDAAYAIRGSDKGFGDLAYLLARYADEFVLGDWKVHRKNLYQRAALHGHPQAAYTAAEGEVESGNLREAAKHMMVASLQGHVEARTRLEALEDQNSVALTQEELASVAYRLRRYEANRC